MKRIKKLCLINIVMFIIGLTFAYGQVLDRPLSQGEKLFKENKPKEAVQVLENELLNGVVSANTYNFLGLGYYQLEEYSKSIDAFNRGIQAQPTNLKILSFNQGNTYYAMKDYSSAVKCYSTALREDPEFHDALLNRANALLMADQLGNARSEYIDFIAKFTEDAQKSQIERLIKALTDEIARREEEARLLEEQNKAMWEEIDPSFDEMSGLETQWEKIDASISEEDNSDKTKWENVDATIAEEDRTDRTDWENVDATISEQNRPKKKTDWEQIDNAHNQQELSRNDNNSEQIYDDDLTQNWENLSSEEALEMKRLERESRLEHEKWLEEQSLLRQKAAEEELRKLQMRDDQERLAREKLLEDMMRAEEARRKKLLDDVANSLQNGDSTNVSSGADELIEYDQEGELD